MSKKRDTKKTLGTGCGLVVLIVVLYVVGTLVGFGTILSLHHLGVITFPDEYIKVPENELSWRQALLSNAVFYSLVVPIAATCRLRKFMKNRSILRTRKENILANTPNINEHLESLSGESYRHAVSVEHFACLLRMGIQPQPVLPNDDVALENARNQVKLEEEAARQRNDQEQAFLAKTFLEMLKKGVMPEVSTEIERAGLKDAENSFFSQVVPRYLEMLRQKKVVPTKLPIESRTLRHAEKKFLEERKEYFRKRNKNAASEYEVDEVARREVEAERAKRKEAETKRKEAEINRKEAEARRRREEREKQAKGMLETGGPIRMPKDADDFEEVCAEFCRKAGFADAKRTPKGPDGGVDVVGFNLVGQAKFHPSSKVTANDVRALVGSRVQQGARVALFFHYGPGYSAESVQFAAQTKVHLFQVDAAKSRFIRVK